MPDYSPTSTITSAAAPDPAAARTKNLTYAGAANAALRRALSEYPETLLFGEDVALPGGVFGVTKGLHKEFGERVFDTPISESVILGGALGAAMVGRRPIVEIMWADFALVALDQLVNQAANLRYVSRGELSASMTVRTQQGTAPGACAQHSQNLEAIFAHIPGLQVCMPATAQDAYDLLLTSITSDDPTIVIENRTLYHGEKSPVLTGGAVQPLGGAATRRPGQDVTVVTWGAISAKVLQVADELAGQGIDCEVVDMRWIRPLDIAAVLNSLQRTGRLVVVHEAHTTGGVGAEILATVMESGLRLRSAPIRVGTPAVRIPAAPMLAAAVIPSTESIRAAIQTSMTGPSRGTSARTTSRDERPGTGEIVPVSPVQRWNPDPGPRPIGKYSQLSSPQPGTRMVFIAGQVGNDEKGTMLEGVAAQTRQALANVQALAASAGAGPKDIIRLLTFLVDEQNLPDYYAARDEVYADWFPGQDYCGHSLAVVAGLAQPGVLIEVEGWVAVAEHALTTPPADAGRPDARLTDAGPAGNSPAGAGAAGSQPQVTTALADSDGPG